jgi:hypothetical protein
MVTNDTLEFARNDRPVRSLPVAWLVLAAITLSGCTKLDLQDSFRLFEKEPKPEVPDRMVAVWTHSVLNQAGQPSTRGFGGRITFFGADDKASVLVDGKLTVYAFDDEREDLENPVPEKKFVFPQENLASHQSESNMGPSYSFWLPWGDVDGPQRRLSLIGRFDDASGKVVLSQSSSVALPGKNGPPQLKVTKTESAAPRPSEYPVQPALYESDRTSVADSTGQDAASRRPRMQTTTIPITPNFANRLGTSTTSETPSRDAGRSLPPQVPPSVSEDRPWPGYSPAPALPASRPGTPPSARSEHGQSPVRTRQATLPSYDPVRRQPFRGEWLRHLPPTPRGQDRAPEDWSEADEEP